MRKPVTIDPAILQEVVHRLTEAVGIDAESLETGRIAWTIEGRCRHLGMQGAAEYVEHLNRADGELDELGELIDALVIQETRFFRDLAVFEHIREWARQAAGKAEGVIRVLSAPCSTGQEAFSVAAELRMAGLAADGFLVDAFDISRAALRTAERGVYAAGSLENFAPELQATCGVLRNNHWHMHEELRRRIRFARRNLSEPDALGEGAGYHLILCRNLFIYLHAEARATLADSLSRALLPGGRLIVGAGDRVPELNARFMPVKPAAGFGFVHKTQTRAADEARRAEPLPRQPRTVKQYPLVAPRVVVAGTAPSAAVEFYRRALEHKDRGNLRQAERRCRQALYLAPGFLPALELLQMLWQVQPNARLRRALGARIVRVRAEGESLAEPAAAGGSGI
jgi:chemotaxis protein methyltransferase WspC